VSACAWACVCVRSSTVGPFWVCVTPLRGGSSGSPFGAACALLHTVAVVAGLGAEAGLSGVEGRTGLVALHRAS
jgi:hypothetical protein